MLLDQRRLLGLAFAGTDLLVELEANGRIALALGAARSLLGADETALTGCAFGSLIANEDRAALEALFADLADGARHGPVTVRAAAHPTAPIALSARRLPEGRFAMSVSRIKSQAAASHPGAEPSHAVGAAMHKTLAQAEALAAMVSARRFTFAFQPVIRMADDAVHHYELAARFENGADPLTMIRTAAAFDLLEELDFAVVEQAVRRVASSEASLKLSVKVTGRTFANPAFVQHVERLLAQHDSARGRLLFEFIDSSTLTDHDAADGHIQALRRMGSLVCLGDFGAGSAAFACLKRLRMDMVKIDGRYVRELVGGPDAHLVRSMLQLFSELNLRTVAAMVESDQIEDAARQAGADFAQGYLYGQPADKPQLPSRLINPPALRKVG